MPIRRSDSRKVSRRCTVAVRPARQHIDRRNELSVSTFSFDFEQILFWLNINYAVNFNINKSKPSPQAGLHAEKSVNGLN